MRRRAQPAKNSSVAAPATTQVPPPEALNVLLNGALTFLVGAGFDRERIAAELRTAATLVESQKPIPKSTSTNYQTMTKVCGLVHDWCWEPEYIDKSTGRPRPLRLDDGPHDLRKLITKRFPKRKSEEIASWMEKNGVVARQLDGTFTLTRRAVMVGQYPALNAERIATLAAQWLETSLHNLRTPESSRRYIDRTSWVFDLPSKYVPQFRELVRQQSHSFLEIIDDWLESRISPDANEPTVEAGVHTYMYVGPESTFKPQKRGAEIRSKPSTRSRPAKPRTRKLSQ
jgi:hypothetical protein